MNDPILASACLLGFACRYDGGTNPCHRLVELYKQGLVIPVCPESLSGLPVPRPPCEIFQGRVISKTGEDVTDAFTRGAEQALAQAQASGCRKAVLKARSPSCGIGRIYDGSFTKNLVPGNGLFAQKLLAAGWEVIDEENFSSS